jgi:hypothetical protein
MMIFRQQTKDDREEAVKWLIARGFPANFGDTLPSMGFCVSDPSGIVSACWVFRDIEGKGCWLVFPCVRLNTLPKHSHAAIRYLIEMTEDALSKTGYSMIFAAAKGGLGKVYQRREWLIGDKDTTQYMKNIRRF